MHLLYIIDARIPTEKAHGYQIMKMCEAFAGMGYTVDLIVPRVENDISEDAFVFYGVARIFSIRYLSIPRLPRHWIFPFSLIPHALSLFFFRRSVMRLIRNSGNEGAVAYVRRGLFVSGVNRHMPVVYEVHGFSRLSFFFRRPYKAASHVIALTAGIKKILIGFGVPSGDVTVLSDAVDLSLFQGNETQVSCRAACGLPSAAKIIGYVGRFRVFNKEKGVEVLIRAMGMVRLRHHTAKLLLVGGPASCIIRYARLADACGLGKENILYVPTVPAWDVGRFMKSCDILTIPLPYSLFSSVCTSPLKMFEYMASGVPVMASDLPALREIVNDQNAFFATAGDYVDWGRRLNAALDNPLEAARRADTAYRDVQKYTWRSRAESISATLSKISWKK